MRLSNRLDRLERQTPEQRHVPVVHATRFGDPPLPEWATQLLQERVALEQPGHIVRFYHTETHPDGRIFAVFGHPRDDGELRHYQVTPDGMAPLEEEPDVPWWPLEGNEHADRFTVGD